MAFKSRSKGKIAKVEGRITELCLSATVCCFLPVTSKPPGGGLIYETDGDARRLA